MTFRDAIKLAGEKAGLVGRDVKAPKEIARVLDQEMQVKPGMTEEGLIDSLAKVLAKYNQNQSRN